MNVRLSGSLVLFGLLACLCWCCVDIPSAAPPIPDPHAQVRWIHAGSGIDTIAFLDTAIARSSGDTGDVRSTVASVSTVISGSDTLTVYDTVIVTVHPRIYYRRYSVNFGDQMNVIEDGGSVATLGFGAATPYLSTPAGSRKISLSMSGLFVDTLVVEPSDTEHIVLTDTLHAGSQRTDDVVSHREYSVNPPASPFSETIIADYKNPALPISTDRKLTVVLVHDLAPITPPAKSEGGRVEYGWINYFVADERYDDRIIRGAPLVAADSVAIRYINASHLTPFKKLWIAGPSAGVTDSIPFISPAPSTGLSPYRHYRAGTYSLAVGDVGSLAPSDSLTGVTLSGGHRYTLLFVDSDTTFHVREYTDD